MYGVGRYVVLDYSKHVCEPSLSQVFYIYVHDKRGMHILDSMQDGYACCLKQFLAFP